MAFVSLTCRPTYKRMKLSTRTIIIGIVLSIVLFFAGYYSWVKLFFALLPVVNNVSYTETSPTGLFINPFLFSLTIALIPIATILIWRFAPVLKPQRKILTVCIIVICVAASILVRREMIKYKASHLQPTIIESSIPVSSLNFEIYALAGLITGSMISFISLRQRTK